MCLALPGVLACCLLVGANLLAVTVLTDAQTMTTVVRVRDQTRAPIPYAEVAVSNFTAFTDGYRTWLNGPFGFHVRLNAQRFPLEANPDRLSAPPQGQEVGK